MGCHISGDTPVISKILSHRWFSKHFKYKKLLDIGVSAVTQSRSPNLTFSGGNASNFLIIGNCCKKNKKFDIAGMGCTFYTKSHFRYCRGVIACYNNQPPTINQAIAPPRNSSANAGIFILSGIGIIPVIKQINDTTPLISIKN